VEPYILAPFDCSVYGDLCDMVGGSHAPTFVCDRWDQARNGDTLAAIQSAGESQLETMTDDWFDERFSNGIGPSHPWWGTVTATPMTGVPSSCEATATLTQTGGDGTVYRLKGHAFVTNTWLFKEIGATSKMMVKAGPVFSRDFTASVEIKASFSSTSPSCSTTTDKTDVDGRVTTSKSSVIWGTYENVIGHASGESYMSGMMDGVYVCNSATWNDPC